MIIKRRRRRTVPGLNTASLPDLIFTVLFFFMIVTHMRNVTPKVKYTVPKGNNLTQIAKKSAVVYVYIGRQNAASGSAGNNADNYSIQVNDRIVNIDELKDCIVAERNKLAPEDVPDMVVSLRADKDCPGSIVSKVKMSLRQANALRINYNATNSNEGL